MCFVCDLMGVTPIEYVEVSAGALHRSTVDVGWFQQISEGVRYFHFYIAQVPPSLVPFYSGQRFSPLFYN